MVPNAGATRFLLVTSLVFVACAVEHAPITNTLPAPAYRGRSELLAGETFRFHISVGVDSRTLGSRMFEADDLVTIDKVTRTSIRITERVINCRATPGGAADAFGLDRMVSNLTGAVIRSSFDVDGRLHSQKIEGPGVVTDVFARRLFPVVDLESASSTFDGKRIGIVSRPLQFAFDRFVLAEQDHPYRFRVTKKETGCTRSLRTDCIYNRYVLADPDRFRDSDVGTSLEDQVVEVRTGMPVWVRRVDEFENMAQSKGPGSQIRVTTTIAR